MSATSRSTVADGFSKKSGRLLEVDDLHVEFRLPRGVVNAVNGVSFTLDAGETLAILGESGSGKSVSAQALMGLIDTPPGYITRGRLRYRGDDLLLMSEKQRRAIRGQRIAMVFQDALTALNPVFTVGWQIAEMLRVHEGMKKKAALARAVELMELVGIPNASGRLHHYPHEFSGGMRQRVMIAMMLSLDPDVLIADEPTTALDVTVQAQVMDLFAELQQRTGMGLILITHDLGVVADVADRVAVMYAGRVVESGSVDEIYHSPAHPYTQGLMRSIPSLTSAGQRLDPIKGAPPTPGNIPSGCSFHPRCPMARDLCRDEDPPLYEIASGRGLALGELPEGRASACHFYPEVLGE